MSATMDMKNVSLVLLTLQNCSQMLLMRFALVSNDYLSSTAVVMQEFIKLVISLVFMVIIDGNSPGQVVQLLRALVFDRPGETAKMAVPGILYAIQNNLLYVAFTLGCRATHSLLLSVRAPPLGWPALGPPLTPLCRSPASPGMWPWPTWRARRARCCTS